MHASDLGKIPFIMQLAVSQPILVEDRWCSWMSLSLFMQLICLQCFDAVGWAAGRASGLWKLWVVGYWRGYLSGARYRLAYGPADATATHCLLLQWNPDWFYLSGTGWYLGSPGKRAVKRVCVCMYVMQLMLMAIHLSMWRERLLHELLSHQTHQVLAISSAWWKHL